MKIAFEVLPLINENMSGIGYCEAGLISEIIEAHPDNSYSLEYFSESNHYQKRERLAPYLREGVRLNECHFSGIFYRTVSNLLPLPYSCFFGRKSQLTHFFNYIVPPFVKGKKIVTVHDMVIKAYPETVRTRTRYMLNFGLKKSMKRADIIITDSEFSKREITKYYPQFAHKLRVVPCGVDCERFHPIEDKSEIERVKDNLGIKGEYFLYLGTIEPRKNLGRLIEAYAKFRQSVENPPLLVLAGGKGWLNSDIYKRVEELKLTDFVMFTKYVPSEDMCGLMNGAVAFAFPSIYEGFGMPPLEAMACGTPVLSSSEASLPEVTGDCAVQVDAHSVESIADGLKKLWLDEDLRRNLSARGLERAKEFTWSNAAEALYSIYEQVLNN